MLFAKRRRATNPKQSKPKRSKPKRSKPYKPKMSNYCKVCFDAKKSKTVFTSHRVRNASGVVMCPTLLSQECNYCKKPGHTLSHCPALKGKYNKPEGNYNKPEGKYNKPSPLRKEQKHEGVEERKKNEERKNEERKNEERKKKNENDTRLEYYQRQDLQRRAAQLCRSPSPPPVDLIDDFPIVGAKNGGPRFISAANTVSAAAQAPLNQWASIVIKQAQQDQAQQDQAKQQAKQQAQQQEQEQDQAKQQAKQQQQEDEDSSDDEDEEQQVQAKQQAKQQAEPHRVVLSWADIE